MYNDEHSDSGPSADTASDDEPLIGTDADDVLEGDDSGELLAGGAGGDMLNGGGGDDVLRGDEIGDGTAITVTVENLLGEGGNFVTPVWFGFHDGEDFDLFDSGKAASEGLERLAEDGTIDVIGEEFAMQTGEAGAAGAVAGEGGPIATGERARATINVTDAQGQGFFTWATMVIPSNDAFLAVPDDALADPIFDAEGNFLGPLVIERTGADVLDAGTEVNNEEGAAFLNQTAPDEGTVENGVVGSHPGFNGSVGNPDGGPVNILSGDAVTAAGTVIDPAVADFTANPDEPILRITIDQLSVEGGDDRLAGGDGQDRIEGGGGNDQLFGDNGDDSLDGGIGDDTLSGGQGQDQLQGGDGDDQLAGDEGDDRIDGGAGNDTLEGGDGNDTFVFTESSGQDRVVGFGQGDDRIDLSAFDFTDVGAALEMVDEKDGDTVIDLGDGDQIRLVGVRVDELEQSDFVV